MRFVPLKGTGIKFGQHCIIFLENLRKYCNVELSPHIVHETALVTCAIPTSQEVSMNKLFSLTLVFCIVLAGLFPVSAQVSVKNNKRQAVQKDKLNKFGQTEAFSDGTGVFVRWAMDVETDNVGFVVYRISAAGQVRANENAILGSRAKDGSEPAYGESYSYFDREGSVGDVYVIEALGAGGEKISSEKVPVAYLGDISSVAGRSSQEMLNAPVAQSVFATSTLRLPKALQTELSMSQTPPDPVTQRQIAAKAGAKFGIRADGFYRVSRAELMSVGFDLSSDPGKWQLYCDGVEQAIQVAPNGDYLEFLGKAKETIESDLRFYFLVVGDTWGKRMGTSVSRPIGLPIPSANYPQTSFVKERVYYIYDILNGPAENFWGRLVSNTGTNFAFNLTGVDPSASSATVNIKLQGYTATAHNVSMTLNGQPVDTSVSSNQSAFGVTMTMPASSLAEGINTLHLNTAVAGDYILFDSIAVSYSRKFLADQDQITFFTTNYRSTKVVGFSTPNVRMFDMTQDGQPLEVLNLNVTPNAGKYDVNLPSNRGRVLYAVENSAAKTVAKVEANIPSTLSVPNHSANLLIITYPDFSRSASKWAQYRANQGISTEVVDVRDIFDEFNYGQSSSDSITAFLEYAVGHWQTPPQYVLLLGEATYDPKNYEGHGYQNFVPTKIVDTVYTETPSDEAMADFNSDGLAEIAIGRIPALTNQDVMNALAKVQAFEVPANQSLGRGALFAYDLPNGYDFAGMSATLRGTLPDSMPAVMVGRGDANSQTTLINEMNNGRYVINYSGHGTTGAWAAVSFFSSNNVVALTNANNQSIFTMLTCLNGYFINPNADSLAEKLLKATNGGAVAAWASGGKTTPDIQMVMATRFYTQIGIGNITRLGDLVSDAKSVIPGGTDVRYSWALLGDPMLKVR